MEKIEVRPFKKGEEEILVKIHNSVFNSYFKPFGSIYGYYPYNQKEIIYFYQNSQVDLWVITANKTVVGFTVCRRTFIEGDRQIPNILYETTREHTGQSIIAIKSQFQNQGFGKKLLQFTLDYYKKKGVKTAIVLAYNTNFQATKLLQSLNFEHQKVFYYPPYSSEKLYTNDSILAVKDLTKTLEIENFHVNPSVTIRQRKKSDIKEIDEIIQKSRPYLFQNQEDKSDRIIFYDQNWSKESFIAEMGGKVVGCMEYSTEGILGIPGVLQEYRRQGIGTTLMYTLLKKMLEQNYKFALADTGFIQQEAINLYIKFNFDVSKELWAWVRIL